jgi:glycine oxidase
VCLAAGAWSGGLARRIGLSLPIKPIRGQIALLASPAPPIAHMLYEGEHYLVPRSDGRTLVGSTVEDAGFDCRPTAQAIGQLLDFALSLVPTLRSASLERSWAGLRPGSADGLPYLDRVPNLANAYVAAGHFRAGLILAPATAVVMSRMIQGLDPGCDLTPFRIGRPTHTAD